MYEILNLLGPGSRVLDLGCRAGSFPAGQYPFLTVKVDLELTHVPNFVVSDACHLPFPDEVFDLIVANHSLEHIVDLQSALLEMGRVIRKSGTIYAAVPGAATFSDKLYRWLAHGGGHVNPFFSAADLADRIANAVGLAPIGCMNLYTSFSFANRHCARWPRRIALLFWGSETFLASLSYFCRRCDAILGTQLSLYGWALYFSNTFPRIEVRNWTNVCVRCGSGQPAEDLQTGGGLKTPIWLPRRYNCAECGALNFFTAD